MLGTQDLIVILVIVLVIFGKRRLYEITRGIGEGIKKYKEGLSESDEINVTPAKSNKRKKETMENKAVLQPRETANNESRRRRK
jgi:sec-independent protein translocase protein TatA